MRIFNKLVRDKIPQIMEDEGCKIKYRILNNEEYKTKLDEKLKEETNEYFKDDNIEELADIVEVIYGILNSRNVSIEEFEKIRLAKAERKGGFQDKIYLEKEE